MKLVIVESPSKAKTIEKYLGKGYHVIASKGHVVDLPKGKLGVDVDNKFKPEYEVTNKISVKQIKDNYKDADEIILAVDPDREGEAIGWHIARVLKLITDEGIIKKKSKPLKRIVFTEITKDAVTNAINNPRTIDMNLVNAQQARRILDRIVGYKLSPLLWKKIAVGLSAGRVQSATVRLVVERENLRDAFKSSEYWNIKVFLDKNSLRASYKESLKDANRGNYDQFEGTKFDLVKIDNKKSDIKDGERCKAIYEEVRTKKFIINKIEEKESLHYASPPFTTSTLQQAGSNNLGYSASKTMKVAQKLYESGLITYMRTDSTNLSLEAIQKIRKHIENAYGMNYLPEKPIFYKSKSALTQEAHEAIRPSDITKSGDDLALTGDSLRLYNLIHRRAISCQMMPAKIINTSIVVVVGKYTFSITAPKVAFPGCLVLYKNRLKEMDLPSFKEGEELYLGDFLAEQNFTEPPARYTEATLIKDLEKNGIGRPSTYAPTITTVMVRKYVVKEAKYLIPTSIGKVVNKLLVANFPNIVDLKFTASMEDSLDKVAEGKIDWVKVLADFYKDFEKTLIKGEKEINKKDYIEIGKSNIKCPICKGVMFVKAGRFGEYLCCRDFPKCKGILSLNSNGQTQQDLNKKANSEGFKKFYNPAPKSDDDRDYVLKYGRFGYYWSHPDSPKVKSNMPLEFNKEMFAQIYGKPEKSSDGKDMILKRGRFGEFWAHPDYPEKKEIKQLDKKKVLEKKKELGLL